LGACPVDTTFYDVAQQLDRAEVPLEDPWPPECVSAGCPYLWPASRNDRTTVSSTLAPDARDHEPSVALLEQLVGRHLDADSGTFGPNLDGTGSVRTQQSS